MARGSPRALPALFTRMSKPPPKAAVASRARTRRSDLTRKAGRGLAPPGLLAPGSAGVAGLLGDVEAVDADVGLAGRGGVAGGDRLLLPRPERDVVVAPADRQHLLAAGEQVGPGEQ